MSCGCLPRLDLHAPIERALARGLTRREAIRSLCAGLSLALAGCATIPEKDRVAAREIEQTGASVDLHAHPGFFPTSPLSMEDQITRMGQGRLRAALFAAVADSPLIRRRPGGGLYAAREPLPDELHTATWRQLERVRARTAGPGLTLLRTPGEVARLGGGSGPGAILAVEGGDFLEGRLDRVEEAYGRDVRSIQLVHYRVNELGDIQTEPPRHGGLTPFGKDVIREMNRLGMLVDLAHLTHDGVRDAVAVTRKPVMLSHTVLETPFARAISRGHGQLIANNGGVVGIFPVNSTYRG